MFSGGIEVEHWLKIGYDRRSDYLRKENHNLKTAKMINK